jgi:hypothetical protein
MPDPSRRLHELWQRSPPARLDAAVPDGALDRAGIEASGASGIALAALLLRNGAWHAAHELAQAAEGEADADALHALLHRMEGDFGNARYWHARVGPHSSHGDAALLAAAAASGIAGLVVGGRYLPAVLTSGLRGSDPILTQRIAAVHRAELDALFLQVLRRGAEP